MFTHIKTLLVTSMVTHMFTNTFAHMFISMLTHIFTHMFTQMITHLCTHMFTCLHLILNRWHWHKHRLFPNARLNLSLSYIDFALVAILHFQSGRVVRELVEPSNITWGQCSNPHVVPPGLAQRIQSNWMQSNSTNTKEAILLQVCWSSKLLAKILSGLKKKMPCSSFATKQGRGVCQGRTWKWTG